MPYIPGIAVLLPCLFSAVLIYTTNQNGLVKRFFSIKPIVFIGKISYSLYLFHWIFIAFAHYITSVEILSTKVIIGITILSFICSILSYYLLETPIRHSKLTFKQSLIYLYLLPSIVVIGYNLSVKSIIKKEKIHLETMISENMNEIINNNTSKILTIGDSHADHLHNFLNYVGNQEGWKSDILNVGECILFVNSKGELKQQSQECLTYWNKIQEYPIIFISFFYDIKRGNKPVPRFMPETFVLPNFDEEFKATLSYLAKTKKVYVFANNMSLTRSILRDMKLAKYGIDKYLSPVKELGNIEKSNEQIHQLVQGIPKNRTYCK